MSRHRGHCTGLSGHRNYPQDSCIRPRDQHLVVIEGEGRCARKRTSGCYAQSHGEHAFFRFKQILGGRLRAKREESQEREASLACQLLNRVRQLGRPQSFPIR